MLVSLASKLNLKTRIIVSVVLMTVVGIGGLASHVTGVLQDDLEKLLAGQIGATVNYVAADIDSKLEMRLATLQEIGTSLKTENLADEPRIQAVLDQRRVSGTQFPAGGGVVALSGKITAEFGPPAPGRRGSVVKDYRRDLQKMAGCKPIILPPRLGRFSQRPVVSLAAPICDDAGNIRGVVFGTIPLSDRDLFGQLENMSQVAGSYLLVVSRREQLIVSANDPKRILQKISAKAAMIHGRFVDRYEGPGIGLNEQDVEVLTVSRNMKSADWFLMAAVPTSTAFAPIENLKKQILMVALLLIVAVSAGLLVLLKKLLSPLDTAGRAMARMTNGSAPLATLPVERNDEVGRLIGHFNKLLLERSAAVEKIDFIAHHDALTGIPNRVLVQDRFEQAAIYADQHGLKVGLLFLDLDNFKAINDSLGHAVGDEMLKAMAARLRTCLRQTDTIGRLGGDEYLIVLRDMSDPAQIERVLKDIMMQLSDPIFIDARELSISASVGIAVYPDDGSDFPSIYKKADTAMYQAKEAGRDTYRFFGPMMNVDSIERLEMRGKLKRALERDEFVLHYQPQIDLDSGTVIGAEALIRWNHPESGLVYPGKFISVAEESGLIVPIGEWVLREACRQAVEWSRTGLPDMVIAVNLSAVQFKRGDLEHTVISALSQSGLKPELLELELTESILIKDTDKVLQLVRRLKSLGVKLSIDDFGTGYSSLAYLKKFAVDKLKIDQSFVRDLAHDPENAAIVRAIVQMAHGLNLRTIAEGVEDQRTVEHLRLLNCNEVQGYHFAKPMPNAQFEEFTRSYGAQAVARTLPRAPFRKGAATSAGNPKRASDAGDAVTPRGAAVAREENTESPASTRAPAASDVSLAP
ncbi:hypothetical protein BH11PSE11_BH11PSE11_29850 [soil metagenome]